MLTQLTKTEAPNSQNQKLPVKHFKRQQTFRTLLENVFKIMYSSEPENLREIDEVVDSAYTAN